MIINYIKGVSHHPDKEIRTMMSKEIGCYEDPDKRGIIKNLRRFYETSYDYKKLLDAHDRDYLKAYVDTVCKYAKPCSKILDVGCGNGLSSYMLYEHGHWVLGADISLFFLAESTHLQNNRLRYQVCDALNLPFADNVFDVVCSNELIEHVTDASRTLTEMTRVLKPGGILVIMGPNLCSPFWAVIDLVKQILGKDGRDVWAETKLQTIKWGCKNLILSVKKRFSPRITFLYREPDLGRAPIGGDSDSVYYASPIDIERFLKSHGMAVIKLCESSTLRGRIMGRIFARFGPYISMVTRKNSSSARTD